ncbi:reverse transcriptase domain-containing protein [Tanacetum coccineum]
MVDMEERKRKRYKSSGDSSFNMRESGEGNINLNNMVGDEEDEMEEDLRGRPCSGPMQRRKREVGDVVGILSTTSFDDTKLPPYPFNYPTRRLTMEEMLAKFIDEGKREHEVIEIFIKEFRTTNELLLKERSNLLREEDNVLKPPSKEDKDLMLLESMLMSHGHCHLGPTDGHHSAKVTARKVYQSGFYWPSVFKDANEYVRRCMRSIFSQSRGNKYILVVVDYVSKWVEAQALPTNDARVVVKFLRSLFARGFPKALISDIGTHFCNSQLETALQRYGVTHKLSTEYHPQSNGQNEVTNGAIKRILERSVGYNPKDWSEKLNDALWAFRTAYKTPTGCTPFRLVYGKACHLPVEIEHKAHWALKQCNMDLTLASESCLMQLNELAELRDDFKVGDKVLLYNSHLKMYPGKLKSKWSGPNIVKTVYPHGAIEITDRDGFRFKVNGQRLKKYYGGDIDKEDDDVIELENDTMRS